MIASSNYCIILLLHHLFIAFSHYCIILKAINWPHSAAVLQFHFKLTSDKMASVLVNDDTIRISEHHIFQCIIDIAKQCQVQKKTPEYGKCLCYLLDTHGIIESQEVNAFFKAAWNHFNRLKMQKIGYNKILEKASKEMRDFQRKSPLPADSSKKRRKSFVSLGSRMQKERTESLLQHINKFVDQEFPELTVTHLLGYLIHRVNIQSDKKIARVGYEIFKSSIIDTKSFEVEEAIAIMHSLTLSRDQMRKMRNILAGKGIYFPTSNELLEGRKKLRPVISPVLNNRGVQVQYLDLVKMTISSIISLVPTEKKEQKEGCLEMVFKDGGDGAGQQVVWNSTSMVDAAENMFQYGITPLKLLRRFNDKTTELLWQNHSPNNCRYLRPIFLIRDKETNSDLLNLVIPTTDKARTELMRDGVCITVGDQGYDVKIIIHDSMKDLKFKKCISGLGGADCILCKSKQADWTNQEKILEGFPINRSAENTMKLYNELVEEDGKIKTRSGDFQIREGLTQQPLTTSDQTSITVTHSYINGTTWFLKVLYRCHINYHHWVEHADPRGEHIRCAKDSFRSYSY